MPTSSLRLLLRHRTYTPRRARCPSWPGMTARGLSAGTIDGEPTPTHRKVLTPARGAAHLHQGVRTMNPLFRRAGPIVRIPLALALGLKISACTLTRPAVYMVESGVAEAIPPRSSPPLKAHLHSGEMVVFATWEEDTENRLLVGTGRRFGPERETPESGTWVLPVDSVALVEVQGREPALGYGAGLTLMASYTVLTAALTVSCLADPKSCFGSCPTFYVEDESGEERLVAEGFSSSVARALEATDLDDPRWTAGGDPVSLRVRNEALETHAIRDLRLRAVPERPGERVFATPDGRFVPTVNLSEPLRCTAAEGDCLSLVRALDGRERFGVTDSTDLAARERVELEFPRPEPTEGGFGLGLVIGARHTFVSTFLFYQMLAYLGGDAGVFLASLERGDEEILRRVRNVLGMLGDLRVEVQGADGKWYLAGTVAEAGPLAADVHLLDLDQAAPEGPIRVRLDMTRGFWRLEYIALAEVRDEVDPRTLLPLSVERLAPTPVPTDGPGEAARPIPVGSPGAAARALSALLDPDRYLVTNPGDHYRVHFELPRLVEGAAHWRLFIESTGHYYEWMRAEWLEEESPERAALMLHRPEVMFRALAPAFKDLEAEMEESFWNSRIRREDHEEG